MEERQMNTARKYLEKQLASEEFRYEFMEEKNKIDIEYHIYVQQKINQGLIKDVEAGRTISEEEFDKRMAECLEP
jgi:hypothetical protein